MEPVTIRPYRNDDNGQIWTLSTLPNIGATANPDLPLSVEPAPWPPSAFPDLADIEASFIDVGGVFLVATINDDVVGAAGYKPTSVDEAEVLRVRVHPALRKRGVGRALMLALEEQARAAGIRRLHLDTALNQPEAMAFYRAIGWIQTGTETRSEWNWTLVYFEKLLDATPGLQPCVRPPVLFVLQVGDEKFEVRVSEDGGTDYEWITGPNRGYGFGTSSSPDRPESEHRVLVEAFLDGIDPATGYLAE